MCIGNSFMKNILNLIFVITITVSLLAGATIVSFGANIIPSPREQMDSGISPTNVVCKAGLKLIIRTNTDSAACVKSDSQDKMLKIGWAKTVTQLLESKPQLSNIGEVKTIKIVPIFADKNKLDTNPDIIKNYNYIFDACAKSALIRAPEVLITSDSETKSVKLSERISPNSCLTSATMITATDTNSIKAIFVKKNDISLIVGELETKVKDIQDVLAKEKKELTELAKQDPQQADYVRKISEKTDNITTLRNELNSARSDLQKNQYALIVGTKAPPKIQTPPEINKSIPEISNATHNYSYVKVVKIISHYSDAGRLKSEPLTSSSFNFIFEACAGKDSIVFPEIMIRSDTETKTVKISESIEASTCQTSSTTIKAADKSTIQGTIITSEDVSKLIVDLENKVTMLKENIAKDKAALAELAKTIPQPDDFRQKITALTDSIINQRNELNQVKHDLITLQYMRN